MLNSVVSDSTNDIPDTIESRNDELWLTGDKFVSENEDRKKKNKFQISSNSRTCLNDDSCVYDMYSNQPAACENCCDLE
jgi:hypothetical protein